MIESVNFDKSKPTEDNGVPDLVCQADHRQAWAEVNRQLRVLPAVLHQDGKVHHHQDLALL